MNSAIFANHTQRKGVQKRSDQDEKIVHGTSATITAMPESTSVH